MNETTNGSALIDARLLEHLKALARTELELRPEQIERIDFDTPIVEGLQLDSLKQVVLMANLEATFGFELSAADLGQVRELQTVGDLVRVIRDRATDLSACH
jgi:acyl carrier protein